MNCCYLRWMFDSSQLCVIKQLDNRALLHLCLAWISKQRRKIALEHLTCLTAVSVVIGWSVAFGISIESHRCQIYHFVVAFQNNI